YLCACGELTCGAGLGDKQLVISRQLAVEQRAAKSTPAKFADEAHAAIAICWRAGSAGDQVVTVPTAKRIARQLFRRVVVCLGKHRRNALALRLVGKSVDVVFGWELVRGSRLIAQQLRNGVVVLAVR